MITKKSIKDLGVTLNELYNGNKQIQIHLSKSQFIFTLVLLDNRGKFDCKISSFGANLWMRTPKGLKYEKYCTLSRLQCAINNSINSKVENVGEITYSLSDEVYTF